MLNILPKIERWYHALTLIGLIGLYICNTPYSPFKEIRVAFTIICIGFIAIAIGGWRKREEGEAGGLIALGYIIIAIGLLSTGW